MTGLDDAKFGLGDPMPAPDDSIALVDDPSGERRDPSAMTSIAGLVGIITANRVAVVKSPRDVGANRRRDASMAVTIIPFDGSIVTDDDHDAMTARSHASSGLGDFE